MLAAYSLQSAHSDKLLSLFGNNSHIKVLFISSDILTSLI